MRVTFLGTGSAMPAGDRVQTGILLTGAETLLIDCGAGVLHRLAQTDVGYESVDTVLLTHHHLDHVADLLPLLKARWLAGEETLTVLGPDGTREVIRGLLSVHDYLRDRVNLTVREVGPDRPDFETEDGAVTEFSVAGYDVRATPTRHSMPCLAYRFEVANADPGDNEAPPAFTFSGDSEAFEALARFADGSAILAHDCSFPDEVDVSNHPTPAKLGAALAATDAAVGRLYLTHLYPHTDGNHEAMVASVRKRWNGDVRVAGDMRTVSVE